MLSVIQRDATMQAGLRKDIRPSYSTRQFAIIAILSLVFIFCVRLIKENALLHGRQDYSIYMNAALAVAVALVGSAFLVFRRRAGGAESRPFRPYYLVAIVPFFVWLTVREYFGAFDVGAILYHLSAGMEGSEADPALRQSIVLFSAACFCVCAALYVLGAHAPKIGTTLNLLAVPVLLFNPLTVQGVYSLSRPVVDLSPGGPHFAPVKADPPVASQHPNVIHIYLESTEATFAKLDGARRAMEPLLRLARRGFSATGITQIEATGWTMAGQVASQCGVPLVFPWAQRVGTHPGENVFMPGATCLTDVLSRDGYRTEFVKGFTLAFAGTDAFLRAHKYGQRTGLSDDPSFDGETSLWGAYDDDMFDFAFDRIERLRQNDSPFYFSLLTNGGHFPHGLIAPSCGPESGRAGSPLPLVAAIDCTNRLTENFVRKLEKAGLLENTVVIVQSDHFIMRNPLGAELGAHRRSNFFTAFGPGVPKKAADRRASMVDVYPTILELLGYDISGHRAALGVSLLSGEPTLIRELGKDELDHSIGAGMELAEALWSSGDGVAVE